MAYLGESLAHILFLDYPTGLESGLLNPEFTAYAWEIEMLSMDEDILAILCCPATKQSVSVADESLVLKVNDAVARGMLMNAGQKLVSEKVEGGLLRADGKILYPIRENIPVMLIDEGIPLDQIS